MSRSILHYQYGRSLAPEGAVANVDIYKNISRVDDCAASHIRLYKRCCVKRRLPPLLRRLIRFSALCTVARCFAGCLIGRRGAIRNLCMIVYVGTRNPRARRTVRQRYSGACVASQQRHVLTHGRAYRQAGKRADRRTRGKMARSDCRVGGWQCCKGRVAKVVAHVGDLDELLCK